MARLTEVFKTRLVEWDGEDDDRGWDDPQSKKSAFQTRSGRKTVADPLEPGLGGMGTLTQLKQTRASDYPLPPPPERKQAPEPRQDLGVWGPPQSPGGPTADDVLEQLRDILHGLENLAEADPSLEDALSSVHAAIQAMEKSK